MALKQKGANGLIAEYVACEHLSKLFKDNDIKTMSIPPDMSDHRIKAEHRVGNELSNENIARARIQGQALANYIYKSLLADPSALGADLDIKIKETRNIVIYHVGYNTHSRKPEDILVEIIGTEKSFLVPISLKAYKSGTVSLGSKSSRATLSRLFMNMEKAKNEEFLSFFGDKGKQLLDLLGLYTKTATYYYNSSHSSSFLDEYEARKGTRKVNNPLRRKEVGSFFEKQHGFKSEHKFSQIFCELFNENFEKLTSQATPEELEQFVVQLRFILGNPEVLSLNAICDPDGSNLRVESSFMSEGYKLLNAILRPGMSIKLLNNNDSGYVKVILSRDALNFTGLSLAVWKDATIQFKLST
jgi:hypothetical protein